MLRADSTPTCSSGELNQGAKKGLSERAATKVLSIPMCGQTLLQSRSSSVAASGCLIENAIAISRIRLLPFTLEPVWFGA